jgi:hypothetical protein
VKEVCKSNPIKTFIFVILIGAVIAVFGMSFEHAQYKVIFFMLLPLIVPLFWSAYPKFFDDENS